MLVWTPHFARCIPTRWRNSLFVLLGENLIFKKRLGVPLIFVLFFKGKKTKEKRKTLSVTLKGKTSM